MKKSARNFLVLASCSLLLAALPARAADVLAHWSFDELVNDGHAFADLHGPYRALITDQSSATLDASKDVPFGKAVTLGPGGTGLSIPALPGIYDHSFTVAAWVKLDDAHERNYLLADWVKPNAYAFGFDNSKVMVMLRNEKLDKNAHTTDIVSGKNLNVPISADAWHHVAWVWDKTGAKSGTMTVYLDGNKAAEVNATGKVPAVIAENHRPASIGYKGDTKSAFHGSVDELWVFNDALSAEQVGNLMKSNDINNNTQLANAAPAAAPPATPTTPANTTGSVDASAAAPATPANATPGTTATPPDNSVAAAPPAPGDATPGNTGASASSTPPMFSVSSSTLGAANSAPPTTPTTPATAKPSTPAAPPAPPSFTVSRPTTPVTPLEPIAPAALAETPAPHYTPARIAGIVASGTMSLSLIIFLFWAAQERSKMR
ncbi:MAG TPA: LamG domain-containing protein [Phycisphaerae bacterium]|nr:LamG domain-containing protein [Phycisphaerae bacterium]